MLQYVGSGFSNGYYSVDVGFYPIRVFESRKEMMDELFGKANYLKNIFKTININWNSYSFIYYFFYNIPITDR